MENSRTQYNSDSTTMLELPSGKGFINPSINQDKILQGISFILISLLVLSIILPLLNILALSFNTGQDASRGGISFFPRDFTLENYQYVFSDARYLTAYGITIARTIIGTLLGVTFTAMGAFALVDRNMPGRNIFAMFFIFTMFFSGGTIPTYINFRNLGLLNNFWVYIFNGALVAAWDMIIMRSFFEAIPASVEESAKLDGANDITIFARIIVPMSRPIISVIALFKAVYHWNDWFSGAYYMRHANMRPVQTLLQEMLSRQESMQTAAMEGGLEALANRTITSQALQMATIVVTVVPIIMIYPFIQKYFIQGLMSGAIKG